jgi:pyrophosphate--fructose-6-phosphate 1-phosphotransferase
VDEYRNLGGFTMIKTGRTKIDTAEKMALSRETCNSLGLDALVVVGGDDSNTNAAFLAQEMFDDGIQVIGVPKTIDGDIQVRDARGQVLCAMSFGFHSAARGFAAGVANLCTDASSDVKYWHICKVMGRVASHLALEVALQTHANMTLIGEDLADYVDEERLAAAQRAGTVDYSAYGMTLRHLSRIISRGIMRRAAAGKNYGVIVIPEGVLEFINEIQTFILKLNTIIADYNRTHDTDFHTAHPRLDDKLEFLHRLARDFRGDIAHPIWSERDDELFEDIPAFFQEGLLTERDSHGNFQFSKVETEKVLVGLVRDYLDMMKERGEFKVGIERAYFRKTLAAGGLDPERFGPLLFRNYDAAGPSERLLERSEIISRKTLEQALTGGGVLAAGEPVPEAVKKIHAKSTPSFKTQIYFYGYDGRGSDPTWFDCTYTYNLGLTVFSLIASGATGQMAALRNLELDFDRWEPLGVPIAPLMHLEERKGKLALVLERSVVDTGSTAFGVVKASREEWLAAHPGPDSYRKPGAVLLDDGGDEPRPMILTLNALQGEAG